VDRKVDNLGEAAMRVLNELFEADPVARNELFSFRTHTDKTALIEHPDIIVGASNDGTGKATLGMLGVINGILTRCNHPRAAMKIDEAGHIVGFCMYVKEDE